MAYKIDPEARYRASHEWVRRDGDLLVVGISDFAQHELSDVVYVELPEEGDAVTRGEPLGALESVKAAEEVYSPVSGMIEAVNSDLADNPQWVNEDPYGKAWLAKIVPSIPEEFDELLDAAAYEALLAEK